MDERPGIPGRVRSHQPDFRADDDVSRGSFNRWVDAEQELAERMGTTQSAVARLEGWTTNPSVNTLRKFAEATGTRLVVSFEPVDAKVSDSDNELREGDATSEPSAREPSGEPSVSVAV